MEQITWEIILFGIGFVILMGFTRVWKRYKGKIKGYYREYWKL